MAQEKCHKRHKQSLAKKTESKVKSELSTIAKEGKVCQRSLVYRSVQSSE